MIPLILAAIGGAIVGNALSSDVEKLKDGGKVPLLAPNGKPSNLTKKQWHLVRTPEFKAWFGDWENDSENASKVVDGNGEPLICYHGTSVKFNIFKESKDGDFGNGIYFALTKQEGRTYAEIDSEINKRKKQYVIEVFLNLRNPYLVYNFDWKNYTFDSFYDENGKIINTKNILIERGFDGLIPFLGREDKSNITKAHEVVVYYPNQIKLADGSNTTFDGSDPDIRYTNGGAIENERRQDYLKWKRKNVTLRGISELGKENGGMGKYGSGLYTASLGNKQMAKEYGKVYFVLNAIPKTPKVVDDTNRAEMFMQDIINNWCKARGMSYNSNKFYDETNVRDEMLKLGYDGLIIKGREMVNYTPPEDIRYYENEEQLEMYYYNKY